MKLARNILAHSLAESTRAGYRSAVASLARFCNEQRIPLSFPVSPDTLALWMAASASKLSFGTIKCYLSGIGTTHAELGAPSPVDYRRSESGVVWRMFRAIKRLQGGHTARQKLPVTVELLLQLERWQHVSSPVGLSKRAAMWLGTCGLLRSGEFVVRNRSSNKLLRRHLVFLDTGLQQLSEPTSWAGAACMRVHIAASKTDPFRYGVDVLVSNEHAITAMAQYLQTRGSIAGDEPLFLGEEGNGPLGADELTHHLRELLQAADIPNADKYAGHSFRRGGATSLAYAGVPDSLIKIMGRWRSFTFARYIDVPLDKVIAAGRSMTSTLLRREKGKRVKFDIAEDCKSLHSLWE